MSRFRAQLILVFDHAIDGPERTVDAVLRRVVALAADATGAAGMAVIDGLATVVHVERTVDCDRDAEGLRHALLEALEAAFGERLRASPRVTVAPRLVAERAQRQATH